MPQSLHLLLVEDNPTDAELLLRELRRAGFEPRWTRVETEAEFLEHLRAGPELVLSDFDLPQFNGLRALELLRQSGQDIPFILVSGTVGEDVAVRAMKEGASDYLMKDRLGRLGPAVVVAQQQSRLRRERAAGEQALVQMEAKYRSIFENSVGGLYRTTSAGRLQIANRTLARIAGYDSPEQMIASITNLAEQIYVHAEDRARFKAEMQANGVVRGFETEMRRKDGSYFWISSDARMVRDDEGNICYEGALQDITARKQAEAKIKAQLEELQRWHDVMLGREERIMELKEQINALLQAAGQPPRFGGHAP